jgi:hypothetical protein
MVERETGKGRGKIHSPLHPYTRGLEWNSLCWLMENERGENKGGKLPFQREWELLRFAKCPFCTLNMSIQVSLTYFHQTSLEQASGRVPCLESQSFSWWPITSTPARGFLDGMLILNVDLNIKTSELLCTGQKGWYQNNMQTEKITICRETIC